MMEIGDEILLRQFKAYCLSQNLWFNSSTFQLHQFQLEKQEYAIPEFPLELERIFTYGKRAEIFFELQLQQHSKFKILEKNIQVNRGKITIGEMDFLIQNRQSQEKIHLELVTKFYLYDEEQELEKDRWVGPNRKDRLSLKLAKLREKQLPLLFKKETRDLLKSLGYLNTEFKQEVCFKADLFVPRKNLNYKEINIQCIKGYWIYFEDFIEEEFSTHQFVIPPKMNWNLDPFFSENGLSFEECKELVSESHKRGKSPLVWQKITETEYQRLFIVFWSKN